MRHDQKRGSRRGAVHISGKPSKNDNKSYQKKQKMLRSEATKKDVDFALVFGWKKPAKIELPCGRGEHS